MAGFAYKTPKTDRERVAAIVIAQNAHTCAQMAERIGLYINGQEAEVFFRELQRAMERAEKES